MEPVGVKVKKHWMKHWLSDQYLNVCFDDDCLGYLINIDDKDLIMALINKALQLIQDTYSPVGLYHLYLAIGYSHELSQKLSFPDNIPLWHDYVVKRAIFVVFSDNELSDSNYQLISNYLTYALCSSLPSQKDNKVKTLYEKSRYLAKLEKMTDVASTLCYEIRSLLPDTYNTYDLLAVLTQVLTF